MNQLFTWEGMLALFLGGAYGAIFGAIPGLTATLAVALFIPLAFFLDPGIALPAIIAISSVAIFAGDVGSAVIKVPGTPASAAYVEELYAVSRRKSPMYGLGISALGSAIGGIIGTILLMFGAGFMNQLARQFTSFEYVWLAVLGLTAGIFATQQSVLKSFASLLLGLLLALIGIDPTLGYGRFHFGSPDLLGGLNYIVVMIGLFGFSEVLAHLGKPASAEPERAAPIHNSLTLFFVQPIRLILRRWWLVLQSSFLGILVGFLPGAGADIGAWVSGSLQKIKGSNEQDPEVAEETVVLAGTSSNNAAVASAWIPALTLGLPGDTVTAIVLGVFMMKGIQPGPLLFEQSPDLIMGLFLAFLISNVVLLPFFGYLTARMANVLVRVPIRWLLSIIAAICVAGAFAINRNPHDIWIMAAMGVLALFLRRHKFPLAQVVLGMVLGPLLEQHFMVSAIKANWDTGAFIERPIALFLMSLTFLIIGAGLYFRRRNNSISS